MERAQQLSLLKQNQQSEHERFECSWNSMLKLWWWCIREDFGYVKDRQ